jgi:hypothetical protein
MRYVLEYRDDVEHTVGMTDYSRNDNEKNAEGYI